MKPSEARGFSKGAAACVLALVVAGAFAKHWSYGLESTGVDFYQFWAVSRALAEGRVSPPASLYSKDVAHDLGARLRVEAQANPGEGRRQRAAAFFTVLEPMGTPFFYTAMRPFAALPYETAYRVFLAASLALFAAAFLWLGRLLRFELWSSLLLLAAFTVAFDGLDSDVRVANVNRLLLAALVPFVALRARLAAASTPRARRLMGLAGGAWLGLLAAWKPVVAPIALGAWLVLLLRRRHADAAAEAIGGILGAGLGFGVGALALGGVAAWAAWARAWDSLLPASALSIEHGNYGPLRILFEATGTESFGRVALPCLVVLGLVVARLRAPSARTAPLVGEGHVHGAASDAALGVGLGFAILLATSGLVWLHYQLLALPALVVLAPTRPADGERTSSRAFTLRTVLWLGAALCIALEPQRLLLGLVAPTHFAAFVVTGDLLLALLTFEALARPPR